jgi:hypothetical protein
MFNDIGNGDVAQNKQIIKCMYKWLINDEKIFNLTPNKEI